MSLPSTDFSAMPWSLMSPGVDSTTAAKLTAAEKATDRFNNTVDKPLASDAFFGEDGFTFADMLDIVNPLQHLPIIAPIYRELTGDSIDPGARIAGDTLYGGPIGLASGVINSAVEAHSGNDIGGTVLSLFSGDENTVDETAISAKNKETFAQSSPNTPVISDNLIAEAGKKTPIAEIATAAPIKDVEVSNLMLPALTTARSESLIKKPDNIEQPRNLSALQLQLSAQMAQQIAEANAVATKPPEKPKASVKDTSEILSESQQTPEKQIADNNNTANPDPLNNQDISAAMLEALTKYQKIYSNPG